MPCMSLSRPCPVAPETGTTGQPRSCGKQALGVFAQLDERSAAVLDEIPFTEGDDDGAPFAGREVGDGEILLLEGIVESTSSTTTSENRTARSASAAESFSSLSTTRARLRRPAVSKSFIFRSRHTKSTEIESRVMPASGPVSRRSSPRMRLMSVDFPALGRPTTAMRSGFVTSSVAAVLIVVPQIVLHWRRRLRRLGWSPRAEPHAARHRGAHALAMLGGKRHGIAKTQRKGLIDAWLAGLSFRLIGDQDDRLARAADEIGEIFVVGRDSARASMRNRIASAARIALSVCARMRPSRVGASAFLQPGRVDDGEAEIGEPGFALPPIARDAGTVVDKRQLLAGQPVEQRRLADVRPADDRERKGHDSFLAALPHPCPNYFEGFTSNGASPDDAAPSCSGSITGVTVTSPLTPPARRRRRRRFGSTFRVQQSLIGCGALTHGLRRIAIAQQNVEDPLGLVQIVIGQRVETVPFLRREAESAVRRHHRSERAFHFLAVAALEDDQRGAQQRDFLVQFVDVLVLGDRVQFLERARLVLTQFRGAMRASVA